MRELLGQKNSLTGSKVETVRGITHKLAWWFTSRSVLCVRGLPSHLHTMQYFLRRDTLGLWGWATQRLDAPNAEGTTRIRPVLVEFMEDTELMLETSSSWPFGTIFQSPLMSWTHKFSIKRRCGSRSVGWTTSFHAGSSVIENLARSWSKRSTPCLYLLYCCTAAGALYVTFNSLSNHSSKAYSQCCHPAMNRKP